MKAAVRPVPAQIKLRLSGHLREKLRHEARASGLSLNREIIRRLESTFGHSIPQVLAELEHKILTVTKHQGAHIMAAIDDLKASVDNAVAVMSAAAAEMAAAADFIRNHPAANNDPALQEMAARLQAAADAEKTAADALHGVDQP